MKNKVSDLLLICSNYSQMGSSFSQMGSAPIWYPTLENYEQFKGAVVYSNSNSKERFLYIYWFGEIDEIDRSIEKEFIKNIFNTSHGKKNTVRWNVHCTPVVKMLDERAEEHYLVKAIHHSKSLKSPSIFVRHNDSLIRYKTTMAINKQVAHVCSKLYSYADHADELREMEKNRIKQEVSKDSDNSQHSSDDHPPVYQNIKKIAH